MSKHAPCALPLDPHAYSALAGYSGQTQHWLGSRFMGSPAYAQAPDNFRRLLLGAGLRGEEELARQRFLLANPTLLQQNAVASVRRRLGYRP